MPEQGKRSLSSRTFDEEREYIETLLNQRFNYFIVFASLLIVAAFGNNALTNTGRGIVLVCGGVASLLMAYIVIRTALLLEPILTQLRQMPDGEEANTDIQFIKGEHPYGYAFRCVRRPFHRNANGFIVAIVGLLAILFLAGGAFLMSGYGDSFLVEEQAEQTGN